MCTQTHQFDVMRYASSPIGLQGRAVCKRGEGGPQSQQHRLRMYSRTWELGQGPHLHERLAGDVPVLSNL